MKRRNHITASPLQRPTSFPTFTHRGSDQNQPTGGGKHVCLFVFSVRLEGVREPQRLFHSSTLLPTEDQQCVFHTTMCRSVCSGMHGIPPPHPANSLTHSASTVTTTTYTHALPYTRRPALPPSPVPPYPLRSCCCCTTVLSSTARTKHAVRSRRWRIARQLDRTV